MIIEGGWKEDGRMVMKGLFYTGKHLEGGCSW